MPGPTQGEKQSVVDSEKSQKSHNDQDVLARLGYKQEFRRDFSRIQLFGLSFSIVGVVQSIACVPSCKAFLCSCHLRKIPFHVYRAVLLYSIPYGGPVGMIWGV